MDVHDSCNYGEITYTKEGKIRCHICGKAFKRPLSHVWQVHGLSARQYKKEFGLQTTTGIMSDDLLEVYRYHNKAHYDKVVGSNLINKGESTRFKQGSKGRTKEMVSEMTRRKLILNLPPNAKKFKERNIKNTIDIVK